MRPDPTRRLTTHDRLIIAAAVVAALVAAMPGSHLLALWLSTGAAILVSHAVAVALLGFGAQQWRSRRRVPGGARGPGMLD